MVYLSGFLYHSLRPWKWPSRNSWFTQNMVIFHRYVNVYQRVMGVLNQVTTPKSNMAGKSLGFVSFSSLACLIIRGHTVIHNVNDVNVSGWDSMGESQTSLLLMVFHPLQKWYSFPLSICIFGVFSKDSIHEMPTRWCPKS